MTIPFFLRSFFFLPFLNPFHFSCPCNNNNHPQQPTTNALHPLSHSPQLPQVDGSAFRLNKTLKAKHMSEFLDAVVTDVAAVHMMDFVTSSSPSVQSSLLEYERATFSAAYKFVRRPPFFFAAAAA